MPAPSGTGSSELLLRKLASPMPPASLLNSKLPLRRALTPVPSLIK